MQPSQPGGLTSEAGVALCPISTAPFRNTDRHTRPTYRKIDVPVHFLIVARPRANEHVLVFRKWEEEEGRVSDSWTPVVAASLWATVRCSAQSVFSGFCSGACSCFPSAQFNVHYVPQKITKRHSKYKHIKSRTFGRKAFPWDFKTRILV